MCSSRKYPYPPQGRLMGIPRGRGVSKAQFFKGQYGTKMEFPEGWEGGFKLQNLPWEGYGYFLEQHNERKYIGSILFYHIFKQSFLFIIKTN